MTRYPILTHRIPDSGFGRALTAKERMFLRWLGVTVPVRSRVLRAHGADYTGVLYRPYDNGRLASLDIGVTVIPEATP